MTRYALVHSGKRVLVVPEDKTGDMRVNCFYLGHIEGAWKLAKAIEEDQYGRVRRSPVKGRLSA